MVRFLRPAVRTAKNNLRKAGGPVYALFTNEQLAAKAPPAVVGDLHAIKRVGEGRVKNEREPSVGIF